MTPIKTTLISDLWDPAVPDSGDALETLRYRSNLLGSDLRITNFGGGNTSSKYDAIDPMTGRSTRVMAVKGSGGDLGSISRAGFAILDLDKLEALKSVYRGEEHEDEMVNFYPSCAFAGNTVPASIDTPLHAFIAYPHVDHLHPDWAIALAASANGKKKLEEFNHRFGRKLVWIPWQRPGFELALTLERAAQQPGCDGILLASHGLFTWGRTQRECYRNTLAIINDLGEFVLEHQERAGDRLFGGSRFKRRADAAEMALEIFPVLRGALATHHRSIGHFNDSAEVLEFCNAPWAPELAALGTSCPDHFIRTRIAPLYVDWDPESGSQSQLENAIRRDLETYRERYTSYYQAQAQPHSPALRDPNPSVALIPGVGMFSFGRSKKEARITAEFYVNAIRVMAGATSMEDDSSNDPIVPQARFPQRSNEFARFHNYVALPPREAFRIEYWALEEAKLRRMPPEKDFARRIFLVIGGGSGIGRALCRRLAAAEAHLMVADRNAEAAGRVREECAALASKEAISSGFADLSSTASLEAVLAATIRQYGGLDGVINTAAMAPAPPESGMRREDEWQSMLNVNVASNYILAALARPVFRKQNLPASIVLTGSANAVVPKAGSESYDVSKAALHHLIRELAIGLAPLVRVNGVAPASVVEGSEMFPRERILFSLRKYGLPAGEDEPTEVLRERLAAFYASRTLTRLPVRPDDCAEAILWLSSDRSSRTTGHIIPVDGGLTEAFLR